MSRGTGRYAHVLTEITNLQEADVARRQAQVALDRRMDEMAQRQAVLEQRLVGIYGALTPEQFTAARRPGLDEVRAEVREVVLDALRRLQTDRVLGRHRHRRADGGALMTNEDPDAGVDEFTDDEYDAIVRAARAERT